MPLDITGRLTAAPRIRAGFIGCGSHAFRNVYPALQFAPVELVATCDLNAEKAAAFARQFGALRSYGDYRDMLQKEELDAVFIVTKHSCHVSSRRFPRLRCVADFLHGRRKSDLGHLGAGVLAGSTV